MVRARPALVVGMLATALLAGCLSSEETAIGFVVHKSTPDGVRPATLTDDDLEGLPLRAGEAFRTAASLGLSTAPLTQAEYDATMYRLASITRDQGSDMGQFAYAGKVLLVAATAK